MTQLRILLLLLLLLHSCFYFCSFSRFESVTSCYYRGAMGVLLVYDVTDAKSFHNLAR